ncbi:MAG TPA: ABC transporter substrate-binding protein [Desulfobacter sp.]|uniref:transporter substrate-binding domain-containing protein n=1 Tax=Desulfobacter sp. UBA2225 TaxID=1961413 RepID=UPI000E896B1C|nr:transporter substrate-binding domain-containing protein [Desulfobacter sp. UBA2225]HAR35075.1 ABC transporter substrate-binding protein [Desulfobacter sp.]
MAIKKAVVVVWITLVSSLFALAARGSAAQENAVLHAPLERIDRKPVVFAMNNLGSDIYKRAMELIYKEAFSRLGYTFAYNLYPLKRSLGESNAGRIDGECARGWLPPAVQKKYPNLIQVREPIWESRICVYSMNPDIRVNEWQDLKKYENIVIGFSKDGVYLERMIRQYGSNSQTFYGASNSTQGLRMLASKRIGIFLGVEDAIGSILNEAEFRQKNIYNAGSVDTLLLYPYLNKKYAHLAEPLASVLKQMKKEQIIDQYILRAQEEVFAPARKITISTGLMPPQKPSPDLTPSFFNKVAEVVTRAFALENYQVSFIFRSRLSAFNMAKEGLVDGTMLWRKTKSRNSHFYFSKPFITAEIVFFHLKSKSFDWQQLDDLSSYRAGIVAGMQYEDLFDAAIFSGQLLSLTAKDETGNFKKLLSGEIDYTPVILESGYDTIREIFPQKTAALFTHHQKPLIRQNFYLLLSKQIKENQKVITDFNQGLYHLEKMDATDVKQFQQSAP